MTLSIRGFSIIGFVLLLGIVGQWLGHAVEYFWIVPASIFLALLVFERIRHPALDINFQLADIADVSPGDPVQQKLVIRNMGQRDCYVEYQLDFFETVAADSGIKRQLIPSKSAVTDEISYVPLVLGRIIPADYYVRVLGKYGLVWWHKHIKSEQAINVVPSRAMSNRSRAGMQRDGLRASKKRVSTGFELLSHREYQYGDSLQSIDWKASARRQKKMVRVMSHEQRIELIILLDCGRTSQLQVGDLSQLFHNVNITAKLSDMALQYGDRVACISYASQPLSIMPLNSGRKARKQLQAMLGNIATQKTESNLLVAALQARRLLRHRGLVVVLTDLYSGDIHSQFAQAISLLSEKHQTLIASLDDQLILDMRWKAASHWLDPYRNLSAIEYARERKLIKMRLIRSGANVVTAAPDVLDQVIIKYYQGLRLKSAV